MRTPLLSDFEDWMKSAGRQFGSRLSFFVEVVDFASKGNSGRPLRLRIPPLKTKIRVYEKYFCFLGQHLSYMCKLRSYNMREVVSGEADSSALQFRNATCICHN